MRAKVHIRRIDADNRLTACTVETRDIEVSPLTSLKYITEDGRRIYLKHDRKHDTFIATVEANK